MASFLDKAMAGRFSRRTSLSSETDDLSPDSDLLAYINSATDVRGDTRLDRIVEAYRMLRLEADDARWHHNPNLREFITQTQDHNPYIPANVKVRAQHSLKQTTLPRKFRDQWIGAGYAIDEILLDVEAMEQEMLSAPDIMDAFKVSNVHDTSYYFTKLSEWHISLMRAREFGAKSLVDLGAAYHGFAEVATKTQPDITVSMVDLAFPSGRNKFKSRIYQIGSDAGNLDMYETGSIDMICSHNAFEHFSGDSDTRCIKEAARILKPGGRILITPLFADEIYSLSINPFACYVAANTTRLTHDIAQELGTERLRVDFRPNIISPYSRRYDLAALKERVLGHVPELTPTLVTPRFKDDGFEGGLYHRKVLGFDLEQSIFDMRVFNGLELVKSA